MRKAKYLVLAVVVGVAILLAACQGAATPTPSPKATTATTPSPTPTASPKPTASPTPTPSPKPTATPASTSPPYFQGKPIQFIVSSGAGGGSDIFVRVVAKHLSAHIPGRPTIVVRNMVAGGGMVAIDYISKAAPNGLTLGLLTMSSMTMNVLRPKGVEFHLEEFGHIYAIGQGKVVVTRPEICKDPRDLIKPEVMGQLVYGHEDPVTETGTILAMEVLGIKPNKWVWGYTGSAGARQAFLAREITLTRESSLGYNASWRGYVEKGEVVPILSLGIFDAAGKEVRDPVGPDVPAVYELYKQIYGKEPSGNAWEAYKVFNCGFSTLSKMLSLPPKVPRNVYDILVKAATDMTKDPAYNADMDKLQPGRRDYLGDELMKIVPVSLSASPDVVDWVKQYYLTNFNIKIGD